ncbi:hypothetical protein B0H11DRAFT_2263130 [Mycena galericulata]|nr:hypothetical protein B0H11DRAFT_2263130 [Mycena galericulata]
MIRTQTVGAGAGANADTRPGAGRANWRTPAQTHRRLVGAAAILPREELQRRGCRRSPPYESTHAGHGRERRFGDSDGHDIPEIKGMGGVSCRNLAHFRLAWLVTFHRASRRILYTRGWRKAVVGAERCYRNASVAGLGAHPTSRSSPALRAPRLAQLLRSAFGWRRESGVRVEPSHAPPLQPVNYDGCRALLLAMQPVPREHSVVTHIASRAAVHAWRYVCRGRKRCRRFAWVWVWVLATLAAPPAVEEVGVEEEGDARDEVEVEVEAEQVVQEGGGGARRTQSACAKQARVLIGSSRGAGEDAVDGVKIRFRRVWGEESFAPSGNVSVALMVAVCGGGGPDDERRGIASSAGAGAITQLFF